MEATPLILEVDGLKKRYKDVVAVDDISFAVHRGEVLGILGPNGSGKTTTLKSALGIIHYDAGRVLFNGKEHRKHRAEMLERTGAVLEGNRNVYWYLSARENLSYFAGLRGLSTRALKPRIDSLLERLDLAAVANKPVREYSRGMQQKVAIACAFLHDPDILFLDEPTLGLDVETARGLRSFVRGLASDEGKTVVVTSHDMGFVEEVCDRILIISKGRIVSHENVDSLKAKYAARKLRLRCDRIITDAALRALEAIPGVACAAEDGRSVVSLSLAEPSALYRLFASLESAGAGIEFLDVDESSLEDIFIDLVKKEAAK